MWLVSAFRKQLVLYFYYLFILYYLYFLGFLVFDFLLQHLFLFLPYKATGLNEDLLEGMEMGTVLLAKCWGFYFLPHLLLLQPLVISYF